MVLGINETEIMGYVFENFTTSITGDQIITGFILVILLGAVSLAFRMPIEIIMIFMLPPILVFTAFAILPGIVAGIVVVVLGFLLAWTVWAWVTNK